MEPHRIQREPHKAPMETQRKPNRTHRDPGQNGSPDAQIGTQRAWSPEGRKGTKWEARGQEISVPRVQHGSPDGPHKKSIRSKMKRQSSKKLKLWQWKLKEGNADISFIL